MEMEASIAQILPSAMLVIFPAPEMFFVMLSVSQMLSQQKFFVQVIIYGPATVVPLSLRTVKDETDFTFDVSISRDISQGRVIIKVANRFCTDEAGNEIVRTRDSKLVIHVGKCSFRRQFQSIR